jgi:tetratricopeptide (TPR) repeat protein
MKRDRFFVQVGRLLPALLLWLTGCANIPDEVRHLADPDTVVELADTPFYAQERYQCGPAALATVLAASDVAVDLEDLVSKVYIPGRKGSFQVELMAATRTSGRLPYVLDKSLSALVSELHAGRPVIVLQNLGVAAIPRWHYAVVVGLDGTSDTVALRSGTDKRRLTPTTLFLRTWERSNYWAMSVLRPGELPANVSRERYFGAVAGLEQVGMHSQAEASWNAALLKWPDDPVALFGLGNSQLHLGKPGDAEKAYRQLLAIRPDSSIASNNLAMALDRQGQHEQALALLHDALQRESDPELIAILRDTLTEIQPK